MAGKSCEVKARKQSRDMMTTGTRSSIGGGGGRGGRINGESRRSAARKRSARTEPGPKYAMHRPIDRSVTAISFLLVYMNIPCRN